jgi:ribosomal protein S18 acetylase RimI-like enzyme
VHVSEVRIAQPADAEPVAALLTEFRDWIGRPWPDAESFRSSARRLLEDPSTEFLLAGAPADGICQLRYRHSVWTGSDDCCIEDVFVRERARGAGLGRALVAAAIERARTRGCGRIEVDTNETNAPALALYRSFGFESGSDEPGGQELQLRVAL